MALYKISRIVRDSEGDVVPSVQVTVNQGGTATLQAIYSDAAGTVKANPLTSGLDGRYEFWVDEGETVDLDFSKTGFTIPSEDGFTVPSVGFDAFLDVRDHGAVGDGVADDTAEIQAALDALDADGGGMLFFPAGQYNISAQIDVPSNVTLFGVGYASRIHMTVADTQMFQVAGEANVGFFGLRLTGQGGFTTPGLGAIRLGLGSAGNGATDSWVSHCWIVGTSNNGVTIGSKSVRCRVIGSLVDGAGEEGVYLLGQDCEVIGNTLQGNGNAGCKVSSAINPLVEGNHCLRNLQQGINWTGASSGGTAKGNTCVENQFEGIRVAELPTDFSIEGNVCIANGQAADNTRGNITLDGTAIANCLIQGNVCRKGALANRSSHGLKIVNGTGILVGPNDFRGGGQTADYTNSGGTVGAVLVEDGGIFQKLVSALPQLRLQAISGGAGVRLQFLGDTGQIWEHRLATGATTYIIRNQTSGTQPFLIVSTAPSDLLRLEGGGVALFAAGSFGSGVGVAYVGNRTTAPTTNPSNGVIVYAEDDAASSELKVRDEAGNITTLS